MNDLLVILLKCGKDCDDFMKQFEEPSMKKFLKENLQIGNVKRLDAETDELAAQVMMSTEDYQLPIIAMLKKGSQEQVCVLRHDPIEIERCVELKKLPK